MTTGLFPIRRTHAGRRPKQKRGPTLVDRFAEALSVHDLATGDEGGNVRACSEALGLSFNHGRQLLRKVRHDIGWQAR